MDNNEKKYSENQIIPIVVITIIVTALVSIVITAFLYYTYLNSKGAIVESFDSSASVEDKLNVIRTEIEKYYLNSDEIEDSELVDAALKGYVAGLGDEYTELMTAKEYEELEQELSDYVGIGIYVGQSLDGEAVILAPVGDDSPAFEAGIKEYDVIVKVNDEDVTGLELEDVTNKIKGKEGTTVKITVERDGKEKEFNVERKSIKVAEIKYEMIDDDIGYIDFDVIGGLTDIDEMHDDMEKIADCANKLHTKTNLPHSISKKTYKKTCDWYFKNLSFDAKGNMGSCGRVINPDKKYGNIDDEGDIWNNEYMQMMRSRFLEPNDVVTKYCEKCVENHLKQSDNYD